MQRKVKTLERHRLPTQGNVIVQKTKRLRLDIENYRRPSNARRDSDNAGGGETKVHDTQCIVTHVLDDVRGKMVLFKKEGNEVQYHRVEGCKLK